MSVTELEEGMLRDKQQQQQQQRYQQQHPGAFPQQNFPSKFRAPLGQFPPSYGPQQQQHHLHAHPGFCMGPPPPGFQQGPPTGGPMLQNQVFGPNRTPQFGSFPGFPLGAAPPASGSSPGGPMIGGPPRQQQQQNQDQQQKPESHIAQFNQLFRVRPHLPNLEQDENLKNAQEAAQQHLQQQQSSRPTQRGDYGQMRYNNAQAQNNRKIVLLHTGFSNEENHQRGASGKGPGPFDG
ncbi:UNVERIFIED_CONTAM: hypothetical protein HDU68_005907, partial [Siphonaria sp. JEL0065]